MKAITNAYKVSVRKSEWKRVLGRPRHKWEDNVERTLNK
jgi:hypothetical protein